MKIQLAEEKMNHEIKVKGLSALLLKLLTEQKPSAKLKTEDFLS